MGDMSSAAAQHDEGADALGPQLPPGRRLELPGRGTTFIRDLEGPPGAPALVLLHGLSATADLNWFPSFFPLGRLVVAVLGQVAQLARPLDLLGDLHPPAGGEVVVLRSQPVVRRLGQLRLTHGPKATGLAPRSCPMLDRS